ncbi:acyltransferase family protein [Microbacterium sp. BWR-S6Y]|uniref:acyltransferase family protein n=1 Tax=Microbacterium sp. BWR-S6Y TaxID=3232073 RepID=UPI0035291ADB
MTTSHAGRRRDLQGLRAVAVLAVVSTHLTGWPRGGFVGVDVFFVLSGFLVTGILLSDLREAGTVRLTAFFARRVKRLLPAAVLVLISVVALGSVLFSTTRAERTLLDALSALGLASNWRFGWEGRDYFATTDMSPLQHFWSLSVEEQFSLAWPLLVLLAVAILPAIARRGRTARVLIALLALLVVVASGAAAGMFTPTDPSLAYFSTLTRVGELAVGAVIAAGAAPLARLPRAVGGLFSWLGVAVIATSFVVVDPDAAFPAPWAALPVAGAALVIAGGVGGDPRHRPLFVLTNPLAVVIGDLSYSLYLWHLPVIVFAGILLPPGPGALAITALAIVVLSVATFLGVEQPVHRMPWPRHAGRANAAPPAAGSVGAAPAVVAATSASPVATPARTRAASARAEEPSPRPRALASRPAGWVPGQRYYPGARPPAIEPGAPATEPGSPAATPGPGAPAVVPAVTAATSRGPRVETAPAATAPSPAPGGDTTSLDVGPTETSPSRPTDRDESWSTWRARFAPRTAMALATLVIGAGATVLAVFVAYGAPTLPGVPLVAAPPAAVAAQDDDALTRLQSDLAAAATANAWPELHPSLDDAIRDSSATNRAHECFTPDRTPDASSCTWGDAGASHHLSLVGDSSAMAYAPAFARLAEESGGAWRVTTVGMYGCRFTDVLIESRDPAVTAGCDARKNAVAAMVAADPADLLVVSNAFTLARTVDGRDLDAADLASATAREVAGWVPAGRTVHLAPPPHGADLGRCFSPVTGPGACLSAVDDVWTQMESATEAQAATTGDAAISALRFTCWQGVCPAFAGQTPVRYDDTHITPAYAERLTPILRGELTSRGLW